METRMAILGRRSIRKYSDDPIAPAVLKDILDGALMAPSAVNNQPWYFVAVQSEDQLIKLKKVFGDISHGIKTVLDQRFPNNPEVVAETLGFFKGLGGAKVCILAFLFKPSQDYDIIAVESVAAAIENMCLMAYDLGVGSCWMTAPLSTGFGPILEQEFAPGKGKFIAAVTLGYPAVIPIPPKRKEGRYTVI